MSRPFRLPDGPGRAGADVDREIALHLELKARELEASGLSPDEARRAALAAFGDTGAVAAACRDERQRTLAARGRRHRVAHVTRDIRGAVRALVRAPGFTAVALLTLALGIGGNAGIFTLVRSVLLAPLPYHEPDRLVQIWTDERALGRQAPEWLTPGDYADWRADNRTFERMTAYQGWGPDLTGTGEPERLGGMAVTADFFPLLGVTPALGRGFAPADDEPGAEPVVVLSDGLWRRRFGADSAILGQAITLNGEPSTVIGVLPRDFRPPLPLQPDVWRPMRRGSADLSREAVILRAIGRVQPGVTLEQAHQDLATIAARLERQFPESNRGRGVWLIPLDEQITGASRPALLALTTAVGLVLLIACVNLANLLLVRGAARSRELAVRAALGAGRGRLVRQLLTESLVLALAGGALGLGLAFVLSGALAAAVPEPVRQVQATRFDAVVVVFTVGVSLVAGLLFGLTPALRAVRGGLMRALRVSSAGGAGRADSRLRSGLVVAELAISVILLVGAGLLLRSFVHMQRVDLGFRTEGLATANVFFPPARYADPARAVAALDAVLDRLRASPAVRAAEATDLPPLAQGGDQDITAWPIGEPPPPPGTSVWYRAVSPGYPALLGMPIVSGRSFEPGDRTGARVGLVNQEAARRFWNGKDPVGRVLATGPTAEDLQVTIVGVLADARPDGPDQPVKPELFLPIGPFRVRGATILMQPTSSTSDAVAAFRAALHDVDPLVPISALGTLERAARDAVAGPRAYATLVTGFAALALLLAGIGVYGVMACAVVERQREIGVRLALGAAPGDIRRLVLRQSARIVLAGVVAGVAGAALTTRLIRSQLFEISILDPATYAAVPAVLAALALLAAWLPARRATRVDPLSVMRAE